MSVTIKKMSTNAIVSEVAWSSATLPNNWVTADSYLQLDSTITAPTGGIQIYTDNVNSVPAYTGAINATSPSPEGLVDNTVTSNLLPLAWSIKEAVVGSTGPVSAEPNNNGLNGRPTDPNAFQWLYMEDKSQVANNQGASNFVNADPSLTVQNVNGIHVAQSPTQFAPSMSPSIIYLESNFASAVTQRTYSTTKLILQAFTQ